MYKREHQSCWHIVGALLLYYCNKIQDLKLKDKAIKVLPNVHSLIIKTSLLFVSSFHTIAVTLPPLKYVECAEHFTLDFSSYCQVLLKSNNTPLYNYYYIEVISPYTDWLIWLYRHTLKLQSIGFLYFKKHVTQCSKWFQHSTWISLEFLWNTFSYCILQDWFSPFSNLWPQCLHVWIIWYITSSVSINEDRSIPYSIWHDTTQMPKYGTLGTHVLQNFT